MRAAVVALVLVACGARGATEPPADGARAGSDFASTCGSADACTTWLARALPDQLPRARGNAHGDDLAAATLGFALFFDTTALSAPDSGVACSRCHQPELGFGDRTPFSVGLGPTTRNAPPLVDAARNFPHFWDGRADSLWSQPLTTIESATEMNGTRLGVAHAIAAGYASQYEAVFGALPDLTDTARFPAQGKPGQPAYDQMALADQAAVDLVYANVGKALEAYDRKLATGPSDFDRFVAGTGALSADARRGMQVFVAAGCPACHDGPYLTDGRYHALDLPLAPGAAADPGRATGVVTLLASEWNSTGAFYDRTPDDPPGLVEDTSDRTVGAFLTPSLRNVGDTGPYGHDGVFPTLDAVVRFHLAGGGPNAADPLLVAQTVSDDDVAALEAFLLGLHGDAAPLPWSFWPST